jgi:hypothetical protein
LALLLSSTFPARCPAIFAIFNFPPPIFFLILCHTFFMQTCCAKCGSEMTCQPEGGCWCFELPHLPMPAESESKGCLCRACLLEKIKAAEASSPSGSLNSISPAPRS